MSSALTTKPARSFEVMTRLLSDSLAYSWTRCGGLGAREQRGDHLDESEDRHRVEEVHANDLLGTLGDHGQLDDRESTRCWWRGSPSGSFTTASSFLKTSTFRSSSSATASMTISRSLRGEVLAEGEVPAGAVGLVLGNLARRDGLA